MPRARCRVAWFLDVVCFFSLNEFGCVACILVSRVAHVCIAAMPLRGLYSGLQVPTPLVACTTCLVERHCVLSRDIVSCLYTHNVYLRHELYIMYTLVIGQAYHDAWNEFYVKYILRKVWPVCLPRMSNAEKMGDVMEAFLAFWWFMEHPANCWQPTYKHGVKRCRCMDPSAFAYVFVHWAPVERASLMGTTIDLNGPRGRYAPQMFQYAFYQRQL